MKSYRVVFSRSAENDLIESVTWGIETWGEQAASGWAREFRRALQQMLRSFPISQPLASESDIFDIEIRQMILGRYRVLFAVDGNTVNVLHIRGPFSDKPEGKKR